MKGFCFFGLVAALFSQPATIDLYYRKRVVLTRDHLKNLERTRTLVELSNQPIIQTFKQNVDNSSSKLSEL